MQKERKDFGSFKEDYIKYKMVGIPTCRAIEKRPNSRYAKDHPIGLKAIAFSLKAPQDKPSCFKYLYTFLKQRIVTRIGIVLFVQIHEGDGDARHSILQRE